MLVSPPKGSGSFEEVSRLNILYVTTVSGTMGFFPGHIKMLQGVGHTVELACNLDKPLPEEIVSLACPQHHISFSRSPFSKDNLAAYWELKKLLSENHYDIVHTHTPNASALVRLACRKLRRAGMKVFYTAHGFHFYTGAPLKNWLIYYPVERFLSRWTDVLITINQEDYTLAQKKMKAKKIVYVPGVGVNLERFGHHSVVRAAKRKELSVPENAILLLSIGELIPRKNHETLIRAVAAMENVYLTIAGSGALLEHLTELINELNISYKINLLGYRRDISELCDACDIFVHPSYQEGLPVAVMEAMASGLPVVCSRIRGNTDLIDENGGVLFDPHSVEDCRAAIELLMATDMRNMGVYNKEKIKKFSLGTVNEQMAGIYEMEC